MRDKAVSVAELKAKLSAYLAESRSERRRIVVMNRKKPVALITPIIEQNIDADTGTGLAGLAGAWSDFPDIESFVNEAYEKRQSEGYREISL